MEDMLAAPPHVGRERDRAGDEPDDVVGEAALEVGSVGAVVHDDERSHDEERRWNRDEEGDPVRTRQRPCGKRAGAGQKHQGHGQLQHAAMMLRRFIGADQGAP
jgi:hypothetical protein